MKCLHRTAPVSGLLTDMNRDTVSLPLTSSLPANWLKENDGHDWTLPQEIVDKTIDKYLQAYEMLTGEKLK